MHQSLKAIQQQLEKIVAQLKTTLQNDEPFGNVHNNWSFPGLTRSELIEETRSIIDLIEDLGGEDVGGQEVRLNDYVRRLQHLQAQTIPNLWGNAGQGVAAFMFTLGGLRKALAPALTRDDHAEAATKFRKLANQLRGMESRMKDLDPRTASLASMVERIELAYEAADQLPADLESLKEARQTIADLAKQAGEDREFLLTTRERASVLDSELRASAEEAKAVVERCETAYSAATSFGLAAAFSERSSALSQSMWLWVIGLVGALVAGSYFGTNELRALSELLKVPNASPFMVILNLFLSLLSVGAPVWFAWLATKQIGQRFRLAEDYAFKASISRAYEGFRREATRFDKEMEARLLTSALDRLDELPLRLVESTSHGSPWHELASSDLVKQAIKAVPGFTEQVKDLAEKALVAVTPRVGRQTAAASEAPSLEQ